MSVAFSIYSKIESFDSAFGKEMAYRMNREIDCYDFIIFVHFDVSSVAHEKLEYVRFWEPCDFLFDIRQRHGQLVDQTIDVEAFGDVTCEWIFAQCGINLLLGGVYGDV